MAAPVVPGPNGPWFVPTGDEIIRFYLIHKILGRPKPQDIITTEDVYSTNPDHLTLDTNAGYFIDNQWYFYTTREDNDHYLTRNGCYLNTSVVNEPIFHKNKVVGFFKIMRFYLGKPPNQMETDWFVHEYRVNPDFFPAANRLDSAVQEKLSSLVVCKILNTQESEEGVRDEHDSSRIDIEEPQNAKEESTN